jgi:hypothetical protein
MHNMERKSRTFLQAQPADGDLASTSLHVLLHRLDRFTEGGVRRVDTNKEPKVTQKPVRLNQFDFDLSDRRESTVHP